MLVTVVLLVLPMMMPVLTPVMPLCSSGQSKLQHSCAFAQRAFELFGALTRFIWVSTTSLEVEPIPSQGWRARTVVNAPRPGKQGVVFA